MPKRPSRVPAPSPQVFDEPSSEPEPQEDEGLLQALSLADGEQDSEPELSGGEGADLSEGEPEGDSDDEDIRDALLDYMNAPEHAEDGRDTGSEDQDE